MDKAELLQKLVSKLEAELSAIEAAQRATAAGVTHAEAKPENDKDTRALEQSYLARGQAQRVLELRAAVAETKAMVVRSFEDDTRIALSAVVTIEDERGTHRVFIAKHGGGSELDGVRVVTPQSPLGQALLGKSTGDSVEVAKRSENLGAQRRDSSVLRGVGGRSPMTVIIVSVE